MPSGADLFASTLLQLGIQDIFTLVGDHLNEALIACHRAGIRIIDMRHESGVTHAADAWARIHRKPAVSLVTGGPGHTNSLTGLATANLAASPLIAVSGAPALSLAGRQVFQVIDQTAMARPAVKWAAEATRATQIPYLLGRAYQEANSGRKGVAYLTIPVDVFAASAENPLPAPLPGPAPHLAPSAGEVEEALDLLAQAKQPLVIAGSGVWWSQADCELESFLQATGLPLFTVTMARGILPDTRPDVFGYADPAINRAFVPIAREADVVLVLGKRLDYRLALGGPRLFRPETLLIQVDVHAPELGANRRIRLGICADVKATLAEMNARAKTRCWPDRKAWFETIRRHTAEFQSRLEEAAQDRGAPPSPAAIYAALRHCLPEETLISWDGGDFVHWGRAMLAARRRGGWLRLGPMGTIGSALPNAVALQLAHPDQPVVLITGDGSLGFYIAELETLVRYNLPVVIIVGNDGGWGLERELQRELTGGATVACELQHTRYDLVMKGFGGEGETVERIEELAPAVKRAFDSRKPYLINVIVRAARSPFTQWQVEGKKT